MTVQQRQRPGLSQRVILAFCVAAVALFVEYVVLSVSLFVIFLRVWPPELFNEPLVWGIGTPSGLRSHSPDFPMHPAEAHVARIPWNLPGLRRSLADQELHPYLSAPLAGVIRMAIPTRQDATAVARAI